MPSSSSIEAGKAHVRIGAQTSDLDRALRAIEGKLKSFGATLGKIGGGMALFGASIQAPLIAAAKEFADTGAALSLASARLGIDAEPLSALQYAAEKAGVSTEGLTSSLGKMQRFVSQAEHGSRQAAGALAEMGLTAKDLQGLSPDQQLGKLADGLAGIGDPGERAATAMKLFGKAGAEMVPLLSTGSAGIDQLTARARALGVTMDGEDAAKGLKLKTALTDLSDVFKKMADTIGAAVAPMLQRQAELFTRVVVAVTEFAKAHQDAISTVAKIAGAIVGVGTALAALGAGLMALAPILAAAFSPVGLVVIGVAAAVAAVAGLGVALYKMSDTAKAAFDGIWGEVTGIAKTFLPIVDVMFGSWKGFTQGMHVAMKVAMDEILIEWYKLERALTTGLGALGSILPKSIATKLGLDFESLKQNFLFGVAAEDILQGDIAAQIATLKGLPKASDLLKGLKLPDLPNFGGGGGDRDDGGGITVGGGIHGTFNSPRVAQQLVVKPDEAVKHYGEVIAGKIETLTKVVREKHGPEFY